MVTLFLVRHGEKEKIQGDPGLTGTGRMQAEQTGEYFSSLKIEKVVASPLKRTQETASIIVEKLHLSFTSDSRLRERMNWGDLPGQSFEDFTVMWERATIHRDETPPFGDSSRNAGRRIENLFNEVCEHVQNDANIVFITHGGIICDFLLNIYSKETLNKKFPSFTETLNAGIKECAITEIKFDKEKLEFHLEKIGFVEHLRNKGTSIEHPLS